MKSLHSHIVSRITQNKSHITWKIVSKSWNTLKDRHRASGDALATVELLKILMEKDITRNCERKA